MKSSQIAQISFKTILRYLRLQEEETLKASNGRKSFLGTLVLIPLLLFLSGCVYVVVGGVGILGGYIVSPDTVEGIAEVNDVALWDAAHEIVSIMGAIQEEDQKAGTMEAIVNGARVTVSTVPLNPTTSKLRVKARKFIFPKMSVAQDVYVKIMSHVRG